MKESTTEKHILTHRMTDGKGVMGADIIFENGKFKICDYVVSAHKNYTLEDWIFLNKVANKIIALDRKFKAKKKS